MARICIEPAQLLHPICTSTLQVRSTYCYKAFMKGATCLDREQEEYKVVISIPCPGWTAAPGSHKRRCQHDSPRRGSRWPRLRLSMIDAAEDNITSISRYYLLTYSEDDRMSSADLDRHVLATNLMVTCPGTTSAPPRRLNSLPSIMTLSHTNHQTCLGLLLASLAWIEISWHQPSSHVALVTHPAEGGGAMRASMLLVGLAGKMQCRRHSAAAVTGWRKRRRHHLIERQRRPTASRREAVRHANAMSGLASAVIG
ncbi:hypothetical protein J3F83DRAFT_557247 [Trichoderma novae-zelandiae]